MKKFDVVGFVMDFEDGSLSDEDTVRGFQSLINSGLVWQLQGMYGRAAQSLIDNGICSKGIDPDQAVINFHSIVVD